MKTFTRSLLLVFCLLSFLPINIYSQTKKFNCLMNYDIKGISINNKMICPLNGFTHGTVDYGVYKQRGFYFAINNDNAVLGTNLLLLETVNFENFDDKRGKGMDCTLVQMGYEQQSTIKGRFWEKDDLVYLSLIQKQEGEDVTMVYIMIPQSN